MQIYEFFIKTKLIFCERKLISQKHSSDSAFINRICLSPVNTLLVSH